jgi:hypothetical protein
MTNAVSSIATKRCEPAKPLQGISGHGTPLIQFHEALLRGPSPFTEGDRELIATYVLPLLPWCPQRDGRAPGH